MVEIEIEFMNFEMKRELPQVEFEFENGNYSLKSIFESKANCERGRDLRRQTETKSGYSFKSIVET